MENNRTKKILVCWVVILTIVTAWLGYKIIDFSSEYVWRETRTSYNFTLEILPKGYGNFTLYLPIPISETGYPSECVEYLTIEGEGRYEVIDSLYGKALLVESSDVLLLGCRMFREGRDMYSSRAGLSMRNDSSAIFGGAGEYWVYCNMSPTIERIEIYESCRINWAVMGTTLGNPNVAHSLYGINVYSEIYKTSITENGWQLVDGESYLIHFD